MIRTILFDIGNVLIKFDPRLALQGLQGRTSYSTAEMVDLLRGWPRINDFESGRVKNEDFFDEICARLKLCDITAQQFADIWSAIFHEEMLVRPETLRSLKERYRLMLLSNTNPLHFGFMRTRYPVLGEFDDAILSFEVGAMKPEPEIFQAAMARAASRPDETVYVDDLEENLVAARSMGIFSIRFENEEQLLAEFRRRGVLI
ncbi:MAG TPA: HAD family phosphatase [Acidobacteriota bacterium]|jgi:putative hydrolase of the HAD superfamily